ncbi:MAG: hypothetical protein WCF33_10775 [Pseudonocardiaceae bacterium]
MTSKDSFTILGAHGVTILGAHGVIDDTRVHELLAAGLPDLDAFATALARLVS